MTYNYQPRCADLDKICIAGLSLRVEYVITACRTAGISLDVPYSTTVEQIVLSMPGYVAAVVRPLLDAVVMGIEILDLCLPKEPQSDEVDRDTLDLSLLDVLACLHAVADILARHGIDADDCFYDVEDLLATLPPADVLALRGIIGGPCIACLSMAMAAFDASNNG